LRPISFSPTDWPFAAKRTARPDRREGVNRLLIILPMLGAQFGGNLNFISDTLAIATPAIINVILYVTGNGIA
jgi:hypothetical protein